MDYAVDYKVHKSIPSVMGRSSQWNDIYAAMYRAHLSGMSVSEIVNLYKGRLTRSAIYHGFKVRGWSVKSRKSRHEPVYYKGFAFYPSGANRLWCQKPGPYYRKSLARIIWEENIGPIQERHNIFHKDGNYKNNAIENLECLPIWIKVAGKNKKF